MAGQLATEATLDAEALEAFASGMRGTVLRPDDGPYDEALRTKAATSWPCSRACSTSERPVRPDAPKTVIRTATA